MNKPSGATRASRVVGLLGGVSILAGLAGLSGCGHLGAQPEPTLTEKAERVEVYFPGQSPRCDSFEDLGMVQAVLEDEKASKDKTQINPAHLDAVLEQLRQEAAKRGASGVFLVERKHQAGGLIAIGNAVRCKGDHHSVSQQ